MKKNAIKIMIGLFVVYIIATVVTDWQNLVQAFNDGQSAGRK